MGCPQMTLAYRVGFQSEDHGAAFFEKGNEYVDYWRSLYPSGVAVGTSNFCPDGGCLGLFLNRYDCTKYSDPTLEVPGLNITEGLSLLQYHLPQRGQVDVMTRITDILTNAFGNNTKGQRL